MAGKKLKEAKTLTLRDKKKAHPGAVKYFSDEEKKAIIDTVAKDLTVPQISIYFYQCQALGLNPILGEICAINYQGKMSIQVMRDGFLTIAHRSGKFAGLRSGVKGEGDKMIGWARVYHRDFKFPVYQEADMSEYSTGKMLWATKPRTMIKKVAESMALRKAFNVSGVYAPEEMELEISKTKAPKKIKIENPDALATTEQMATLTALTKDMKQDELPEALQKLNKPKPNQTISLSRQEARDLLIELTSKK